MNCRLKYLNNEAVATKIEKSIYKHLQSCLSIKQIILEPGNGIENGDMSRVRSDFIRIRITLNMNHFRIRLLKSKSNSKFLLKCQAADQDEASYPLLKRAQ